MDTELVYCNGIAGDSGDYLVSPLSVEQISQIAQSVHVDAAHLSEIQWVVQRRHEKQLTALPRGIDSNNLGQAGWGVIFPQDNDSPQREGLAELLAHRRLQCGGRYREFVGSDGYRPGESKIDFLTRHGMGPGVLDPERIPFYLLIAASPEVIPFDFQFQLDVKYGVGRVHFDDVDGYRAYARSVVRAELPESSVPHRSIFFGPRHGGDFATQRSADHLIIPLAERLAAEESNWSVRALVREQATKSSLLTILHKDAAPALLLTASHGLAFPNGDSRQRRTNGALVCQDWPGPLQWEIGKPIPPNMYVSADDVAGDAVLLGRIAVVFACFGAGTPKTDSFMRSATGTAMDIAPCSFLSELAKRMLAHPPGGALAFVGHVERAWPSSFLWKRAGEQLHTFKDLLSRLMNGERVGAALDGFNSRYSELSNDLTEELRNIKEGGKSVKAAQLADLWLAHEDARGYVIVGDPAVRLNLAS